MNTEDSNDLKSVSCYLSSVDDFRMENKCLHKLSETAYFARSASIFLIGLLTYLSSDEDYEDMEVYFVRSMKYLKLGNMITDVTCTERSGVQNTQVQYCFVRKSVIVRKSR